MGITDAMSSTTFFFTRLRSGSFAERGFTIVELLVVVVVIAILASVTVVAYGNISNKAKDSVVKQEVSTIVKALQMYSIRTEDTQFIGDGSNCGYHGTGYIGGEYLGNPTIKECLVSVSSPDLVKMGRTNSIMKINCMFNGEYRVYILAQMRTEPQNPNMIESICNPATSPYWTTLADWDVTYGMNYYVQVN